MAEHQAEEHKPSGYCYPPQHDPRHISKPSSILLTENHQIQASCNFEASNTAEDQVYDLTAGVQMIGFHHHKTAAAAGGSGTTPTNPMMYKGFFHQKQPILQLPTTSSSSSKAINQASTTATTTDHFNYQQDQGLNMRGTDDHYSTRGALRCVFPCEGNERPSQGLSLSLNSNNPSSIGLQSFELRRPTSTTYHRSSRRHHQQGGSTSEGTDHHHQDFRLISSPPSSTWNTDHGGYHAGGGGGAAVGAEYDHAGGQPFLVLSYSKYFRAAQELLNEFCKLGSKEADAATHDDERQSQRQGHNTKNKLWEHEEFNDHGNNNINASSSSGGGGSSSREQQLQCALYGLDLLELQKRKRRLFAMLEELERRYRHYSNEMKSVVSSFEAVAGDGSANVYTCLASKAMSRHFRCLKDGIVGHIKAIKKAVGEKDPPSSSAAASSAGTTKGETPRLRILDQTLRQQRAFQQMTMMETHPWRPQRGLPERSVSLLRAWLFEHFLHPYPSDVDKHILARQTGLTRSQVSNWFINARVRLWKPMVEEMYLEETKEEQEKFMASSSSDHHDQLLVTNNNNNSNSNNNDDDNGGCNNHNILNDHHASYGLRQTTQQQHDDEKPNVDSLIRFGRDSECISSIIANNNPADKNINKSIKIPPLHANNSLLHQQQQQRQEGHFGRVVEAFGPIDIDFASYNDNAQHHGHHQSFGAAPSTSNAAGGVSLTLGLQQNGGNNNGGRTVSLPFSDHNATTAAPHDEHSLYYPTGDDDRMEPAAVHEYSLFDGDHGGQNLPYRNLMGAQMLHDFA